MDNEPYKVRTRAVTLAMRGEESRNEEEETSRVEEIYLNLHSEIPLL